jgi:hypothetical protein
MIYKRPIEAVEDARATTLCNVYAAVFIAAAVMFVTGSGALLDWANTLPVGPVGDFVLNAAQAWYDAMDRVGLTAPAKAVRQFLLAFEKWR